MATLHLNLKKKWFDMIASGEKKEEYREFKPYWIKRIIDINEPEEDIHAIRNTPYDIVYDVIENKYPFDQVLIDYWSELKKFETITFSNGMAKNRRQMVIELKNITYKYGNQDWGAPVKKSLSFGLGEILTKNF